MILTISGSRTINNRHLVWKIMSRHHDIVDSLIQGGALGVDTLAKEYCIFYNLPFESMKPNWKKHGKRAGILRNMDMINNSNGVIAIWDGKSKGTKHAIDYTLKQQKPVFLYTVDIKTWDVDFNFTWKS